MRWIAVAATMTAGLLAACGARDSQNVADAKVDTADLMKDPGSAQFRLLRELPTGVVCGEVNAKNEMGGYTGFQTFVFVPSNVKKPEDKGISRAHLSGENPLNDPLHPGADTKFADYFTMYGCW